jgi:hypothetical protein
VLRVDDLDAAARATGADPVGGSGSVTVAASRACGVMLVFSARSGDAPDIGGERNG